MALRDKPKAIIVLVAVAILLTLVYRCAQAEPDRPYVETPDHEGAHFFEVYQCGDLLLVFFALDADKAAVFSAQYLEHPAIRRVTILARERAKEEGTAFVIRDDSDCGDF